MIFSLITVAVVHLCVLSYRYWLRRSVEICWAFYEGLLKVTAVVFIASFGLTYEYNAV